MLTIWEKVIRALGPESIRQEDGHSLIRCADCKRDLRLSIHHWCHPTQNEDIRFWSCPPCVNKVRMEQGKAPLGRYAFKQAVLDAFED